MKSQEQLHKEAQDVLECVGEKIKSECESSVVSEDINTLTNLIDSYCRLFALLKR